MDSSRDNILTRFTTFWLALATFLIFGVLLLLVWIFNTKDGSSVDALEAKAAEVRYKTKEEILKAQAAVIPAEAIEAATTKVAAQLAASKPSVAKVPEQLVPGSKTAADIIDNAPPDAALMEIGKAQFLVCSACHGQNGEGGPAGPPLAGSEWVNDKSPINLIRIQMRGLTGPITVAGKEYTFPAGMPPASYQTDEQIAGVLTFIRNSFGNKAPTVKAEDVAKHRSEAANTTPLTVADLEKPAP